MQRAVLSERLSAATLVPSVHHEHMTALWLSGLQLLGDDDCNGMASWGGSSVKNWKVTVQQKQEAMHF